MISHAQKRPKGFYITYTLSCVLALLLLAVSPKLSAVEIAATRPTSPFRLLVLGRDRASGLYDVVLLATLDTESSRICVLQIPRDTYLRYTERDYKKINGAPTALGGPEAFCDFLGSALGVRIEGYAVLGLEALGRMVDLVGGVEIDIPTDMDYDDPYQGLSIHLKKGKQRLDGKAAEGFVRYRSGYARGDLDRIDAQKLFLAALYRAVMSMTPSQMARVAATAMRSVQTDVGLPRLVSLVTACGKVPAENITLVTLPGEEVRSSVSGAWYYVASREGTEQVLCDHFGMAEVPRGFDSEGLFYDPRRKEFADIYHRAVLPLYHTLGAENQQE